MAGSRCRTLLLVAAKTGYQTREFATRAQSLGYEIQLATDRCDHLDDPWGDQAIALKFDRPDEAADALSGRVFNGIVAVGDRPAEIAAGIAEKLNIPFHPQRAVAASRNKFEAKRLFAAAGLPVPEYRCVQLDDDPAGAAREASYPCVLKPLGLSASRGVIRADTLEQFVAAFERIRALLGEPEIRRMRDEQDRFLLVEEFIPGREFAVEGIMSAGKLDILAIFDKPDPLDGPFFEETIYVTPSRASLPGQDAIRRATATAVGALGLDHGPVHAEMRVNERGVWMLEIAPRPIGGLCAAALRFSNGDRLEDVILRHAAGDYEQPPELADPARGVMMIPIPKEGVYAGVQGIEEAGRVRGIEDVVITAKEGQRLVPLPEGASYLGFIFARGDGAAEVEESLRRAHGCLSFDIGAVLPVIRHGQNPSEPRP
jgi:biotin carboxylase